MKKNAQNNTATACGLGLLRIPQEKNILYLLEVWKYSELAFQGSSSTPDEPVPSFKEKISLYDVKFSAALMKLLDQINDLNRDTSEHDRLFNLLYRLDFNSFYSGQIEKLGFNRLTKNSSGNLLEDSKIDIGFTLYISPGTRTAH
ncbi:hypothetical protein NQ318_022877 [Aromia moschata]|uniref:Uncharacterized protein n=1 Tax=Aromia moschata TaxID=1265417 RepID=A0AAV8XIS6_9CUCU|nr:hypothetical protein NQ318_022877 [Aromia moschata]